MKKFIIYILLLFIFPITVFGLDYKYSDEYIKSDYYDISEEKVYKFYKEVKTYSDDYYLESENDNNYPNKSDIFIIKESDYAFDRPKERLNREILTKKVSGYYGLNPINRIILRGFSQNEIRLVEIQIYYDGQQIDYDYDCINCTGYAVTFFDNNIFTESNGTITTSSVVDINLLKDYDPTKILVKIYFMSWQEQKFKFNAYYYDNSVKNLFTSYDNSNNIDYIKFTLFVDSTTFNALNHTEPTNLKLNKENIVRYKWDNNLIFSDNKLDDSYYQKENNKLMYKYIDKYYKYYRLDRVYLKNYYLNVDNYIKDVKDFKIRYKYTKKNIFNIKEIVSEKISKSEIKQVSNTVKNNIKKTPIIYKFRHIYIVIILASLFLMGYMIYCLRKE